MTGDIAHILVYALTQSSLQWTEFLTSNRSDCSDKQTSFLSLEI